MLWLPSSLKIKLLKLWHNQSILLMGTSVRLGVVVRGARVVDADNDDGSRVIMVYREACVQCMPEDGGEDGDCAAPDAPTPRFIYA